MNALTNCLVQNRQYILLFLSMAEIYNIIYFLNVVSASLALNKTITPQSHYSMVYSSLFSCGQVRRGYFFKRRGDFLICLLALPDLPLLLSLEDLLSITSSSPSPLIHFLHLWSY